MWCSRGGFHDAVLAVGLGGSKGALSGVVLGVATFSVQCFDAVCSDWGLFGGATALGCIPRGEGVRRIWVSAGDEGFDGALLGAVVALMV